MVFFFFSPSLKQIKHRLYKTILGIILRNSEKGKGIIL